MTKENVNIYDIAKEAGVSIATVSRAMNNPEKLRKETKEKIEKAMKKLSYTPNALAQSLVSKSTRTLGVIIANINNPFYGEMVRAIEDRASDKGYTILLGNTDNKFEEEEKYIDIFLKKQVDGIIFAGGRRISEKYNRHLIKVAENIPVVLTNHILQNKNIYCVLSDEAKGTELLMNYLIEKGHREIAYINGYADSYASIIKKENYLKILSKNSIPIVDELIIDSPSDDMRGGYRACEILLERGKFTALFAANDLMAIGAIRCLTARGYNVPSDIAVAGYDDIDLCNYVSPSLTSVTQNISELGSIAVDIMTDVLECKEAGRLIFIEPKLVVRQSA
ncbi:transcriptional regulator, LacI family [Caloramator quimbayensis]|uniref:Transcriptional regulator, LacI family n=1 Tax=Caloramator quimbayensis TaxID=1147123 RepID=A0A1T4WR46_9CLOT|nr:LacI family DNA-binding transcriptional regulator [Caloramator quimbayensis]SKA79842.1 transcriptional regulator, LacI family [Caloramator quimbayensis]